MKVKITKNIQASKEKVFETIADIRNFSKVVDTIVNVEFLSEMKVGVGTKFKETRLMQGKEASTILECTEYIENDRVRLVSDTHGTIWDSIFTVNELDGMTQLKLVMTARTKNIFYSVMNVIFKGIMSKAIEKDMDAVKAYCEK